MPELRDSVKAVVESTGGTMKPMQRTWHCKWSWPNDGEVAIWWQPPKQQWQSDSNEGLDQEIDELILCAPGIS
jgi:hypothetical protein